MMYSRHYVGLSVAWKVSEHIENLKTTVLVRLITYQKLIKYTSVNNLLDCQIITLIENFPYQKANVKKSNQK